MKTVLLSVLILLLIIDPVKSQLKTESRDKYTLLTMPYNKRPLTLYRGQLQVNGGFKFAVKGRTFDKEGELVNLRETGTESVYNYYFGQIRYGVTNFFEIGFETSYLRRGERSESVIYLSTAEEIGVNNITEIKGFGDLFLTGSVRLPLEYKWFDFSLRGGIYLPSAEYEPQKPNHSVTNVLSASSFTINYNYKKPNGYGVPVCLFAATAKFSYKMLSLELAHTVRDPVKEGNNLRWDEALTASRSFIYTNTQFRYLLNRTTITEATLAYQSTGWFNLYLKGSKSHSDRGWTEYWGNKYKNPEQKVFTLEPGFELQISPRITVYQIAGFPVSGVNSDAPFYMLTTISLNMFPLLR